MFRDINCIRNSDHNTTLAQIYGKDSFDRFGDDLCQLLLSYLSFEDKYRNECLSKQIKLLIFSSVRHLNTEDILKVVIKDNICGKKFFDFSIIDTIIQKNPYIQRISCRLTEQYTREMVEVMDHLRDNCLHLRQINCHF